nr:putative ribonuclease H-like domain-containing protein [Tanacetum cinerariifolium]
MCASYVSLVRELKVIIITLHLAKLSIKLILSFHLLSCSPDPMGFLWIAKSIFKGQRYVYLDTYQSSDFQLPNENHVLLRVPRENNMYNVDLKNIVPSGDLTCLFAKATLDESNLWHRRLGDINFKTMNKLVKVVTDDYSIFSWVFFLATKDETSTILKTFITGIENQINLKVKIIRSDNGTELKNQDLNQFCRIKRIKREYSVARIPQQNGITERNNSTLIEAARTMLADSLSPIPFWAKAVNTAYYVQNRVLVTKPDNKTPYELLLGITPSIGFMRPFGCLVTILNTLDPLGKFDGKADEGYLVGYSVSSKAFRVFNGNQPNSGAGIQEHFDAGKAREGNVQQYMLLSLWSIGSKDPQNTDVDTTFEVKDLESEFHVSPSSSVKTKEHDDKTRKEAKGKNPIELSTGVRNLSEEFEDFPDNSINGVNAASTPITTVGQNSTHNTNIFSAVGPSKTVVSPTLRKSSYADPYQYPDDPDMPALEDITYSDNDEDVGVEADFSNLETNITVSHIPTTRVHKDHLVTQIIVARIEAIRLFLAYASFMGFMVYQMDVKSAFFYGTIEEEIYVCQPLGFKDPDYPDKRGNIDQILFIKKQKGDILLVQVYVDDIIFGSTNKDLCKAFEKLMKDKFQMSSMGELTFFLRLQVKQKQNGIFISQDKYVAEILRKFGLADGKSASTPIYTEKPLFKDLDCEDVDVHTYRSMIGSLMYLTSSRPNIMFAVCACAYFQVNPKASHLHAVNRIFRYLKGKPHLGLWYPKDLPFNLVAYSDSDYVGASLDRKFTTGGCQFLGCRLISWLIINAVSSKLMPFGLRIDVVHLLLLGHKYALVVNPTVYVSCIKQFWSSVSIKKTNDVVRLRALIDRKNVIITEDTVKKALHLDDAKSDDCFPNEEIFVELARMGYEKPSLKLTFYKAFFLAQWKFLIHTILQFMSAKRTTWNEFSSSMASAIICLATGRKFNFSKYIFDSLVRNVDTSSKFNMVGKEFSGVDTPLFEGMLVPQQVHVDIDATGRLEESQAQVYHLDLEHAQKVLKVVTDAAATTAATTITAAPMPTANAARRREGLNEVTEKVKRKDKQDNAVLRYQALKRKPQTEAQARKNMTIYLKNMAGFKMNFFKGMSYDDIRPIFKKHFNSIMAFLKKGKKELEEEAGKVIKRRSETPKEKAAKKQKLDEEVEDLKTHLQIVPNDEDDVYTEATPLALKVPIVDYQIHTEHNKPYYKIIRADGSHQLFLSFISMLRNFNREDLEMQWKIIQEKFASSEPKNFSDDFLLNTLKTIFEKPDVEAHI